MSVNPARSLAQRILEAPDRRAQAYLFCGPDLEGQEALARTWAAGLMSRDSAETAAVLRRIESGNHPDFHVLEPSGASEQIKIEDARAVLARVALRPFQAPAQVVLIRNAERMNEESGNCLLKGLEEPSRYTHFALTTRSVRRCLPTIVSRCRLVRCQGLPEETIAARLAEEEGMDAPAARLAARFAQGSYARGVERAAQEKGGGIAALQYGVRSWLEAGLDDSRAGVKLLLEGLAEWARDLVVLKAANPDPERLTFAADLECLRFQAERIDLDAGIELAAGLLELRQSLEGNANSKLVLAAARERWLSAVPEAPRA